MLKSKNSPINNINININNGGNTATSAQDREN